MRPKLRHFVLWLLLLATIAWGSTSPATQPISPQPISPAEQARLDRGQKVRQVLLDTLEQAYGNDGQWPDRLASSDDTDLKLVYLKPDKSATKLDPTVPDKALSKITAIMVLHEPIEDHPDGVWVGYADGHLEFALSATSLRDCQKQLDIVVEDKPEPTTQPTPKAGQLTLKLIDANGNPVSGARVGTYIEYKDKGPQIVVPTFAFRNPVKIESDREGLATIPATTAFDAKFRYQPSVPLYIVHGTRQLMAEIELHRSDFDQKMVREVRMLPACDVHGRLTSLGLMAANKNLSWTNVMIFKPGEIGRYTFECESTAQTFDCLLPAGDFGLEAYGEDAQSAYRYIRIEPGQEEIDLQLDLPPATITQLVGHPAPEFRQIKGWMNGGPVKLSDLRGKVVLLDFWGTWCGPCVYSMPALMKVYDENTNKGLVVIAVHDDSLDSVQALSVKLDEIRNMKGPGWNGRELPFPVALDGGGETRIKYSSDTGRGATTAAYGINSFPTTIAVGRDGNVIGIVTVRSPEGLAKIQKLIDSK